VFIPDKLLQPSLLFVNKADAYLRGVNYEIMPQKVS
jgi:hypothetical protein